MRVLFTGGGTLGPVTPLLAIARELIKTKHSSPAQMHWIGTPTGPEKDLIASYNISFSSVQSGKLRRYLSLKNFIDPFLLMTGVVQARGVIKRFKPDVIIGAGGYIQVPVIWAGWSMKKRSAIIQLDMVPGLANLMVASMVDKILLAFPEQSKDFPKKKIVITGLPIRPEIADSQKCSDAQKKKLGIDPALPTIFITGGGTGSESLNQLITATLPDLVAHYNVVHLTGKHKQIAHPALGLGEGRYQQFELLADEYPSYFAAADVIITRGGMGALSECAFVQKPMIIIPIPKSPQEKNAEYFESKGGALWRSQDTYTPEQLIKDIASILKPTRYASMQHALQDTIPSHAASRMVDAIISIT